MIYIEDSTNRIGVYKERPGKERFEFHRLTAREALCYTQTSKYWPFWQYHEEPTRQTPSWLNPAKNEHWQPTTMNGCVIVAERLGGSREALEEFAGQLGCNMILLERYFEGYVYHYSPAAEKIVREGMKCDNSFKDTGHLSFGPGCYVYHDERYKQDGTEHPWLRGTYRGMLYECIYYDDDDHLDYGYIPYDFQTIKWEYLGRV